MLFNILILFLSWVSKLKCDDIEDYYNNDFKYRFEKYDIIYSQKDNTFNLISNDYYNSTSTKIISLSFISLTESLFANENNNAVVNNNSKIQYIFTNSTWVNITKSTFNELKLITFYFNTVPITPLSFSISLFLDNGTICTHYNNSNKNELKMKIGSFLINMTINSSLANKDTKKEELNTNSYWDLFFKVNENDQTKIDSTLQEIGIRKAIIGDNGYCYFSMFYKNNTTIKKLDNNYPSIPTSGGIYEIKFNKENIINYYMIYNLNYTIEILNKLTFSWSLFFIFISLTVICVIVYKIIIYFKDLIQSSKMDKFESYWARVQNFKVEDITYSDSDSDDSE